MAQTTNKAMSVLEWSMLAVLSVFWGGSFLFVGIAVSDFQPFSIALLRVIIGAAVLWTVILAARIKMPKDLRLWAAFFVMGVTNSAVPFSLIAWGQSHIASGLASILIASTPLMTVVFAHFTTADERMSPGRVVGTLFGLAGVTVLIGLDALRGGSDFVAQLAILGAAFFYASSSIFGRRFARLEVPPMVVATGQVTVAAVLLLPMVLLIDQPWALPVPAPRAWAAIGALGVLSTGVAYLIYFRVLATAGATNLMLVNLIIPITAILLGIWILGETLLSQHIAGMVLIAVGLLLIDGRLFARFAQFMQSRAR